MLYLFFTFSRIVIAIKHAGLHLVRALYANVRLCAETGQFQPILPDLCRCAESSAPLSSALQKGQYMKLGIFTAVIIFATNVASQFAHAIDCAKAITDNEKMICADPKLLAADEAMNLAYRSLLRNAVEPQKSKYIIDQRIWHDAHSNECYEGSNLGCVKSFIERTAYLAGKPIMGEVVLPLPIPVVEAEAGATENTHNVSELLQFMSPSNLGDLAFNKYVIDTWGENDFEPDLSVEGQFWESKMKLILANANLLGASYTGGGYTGGAHGQGYSSAIYFNRKSGRVIGFDDVFKKGSLDVLLPLCSSQADEPLIIANNEVQNLRNAVGNLAFWEFTPNGAELNFEPYSIGGYIQSVYSCSMSSAVLQKLVKPEFQIWK